MERIQIENELAVETRNYGVDLLRIVGMCMVTTMHALVRGGVVFGSADIGLNFYLCWIVEALCEVATDCFFLISGYYLVEQPAHVSRVVSLWCTVLFYSWGIWLAFMAFGLAQHHPDSPLLGTLLPVTTNNYWFITSYIALIFLSPYVNLSIHAMSERQMRGLVAVLLILLSVWPTLFPMVMTFEHHGGLDFSWSLAVYLCAAYLRLHRKSVPKKWLCLTVYFGCCAAALIARFLFSHYGNSGTPLLLDYANTILTYNSPLVFVAAIALFRFFLQLKIERPGLRRVIRYFAPTVLAAYLIQEQHQLSGYLWGKWLPMRPLAGNWWFLLYLAVVCLLLVLASCVIDRGRDALFSAGMRLGKAAFARLRGQKSAKR